MTRRLIPNSTQIPDLILDEWMPNLSPSEFVVVMFIARKTYGWGKASDELSRAQIQESTGLGKSALDEALTRLSSDNGPIIRTLSPLPVGHPKAWSSYAINVDWDGVLPDARKRSTCQPSRRGEGPAVAGIPPNDAQPPRRMDSNPPATAGTTRDTVTRNNYTRNNSPHTPTENTGTDAGYLPPLAQDLEGFTDDPWTPGPARKPNPPHSRNETQAQSASAEGRNMCGAAAGRGVVKTDTRQQEIDAFLAEHPHCADELSRRGDTATRSRVGLEYSVVCGWIAEPDTMPEKPAPAPKKHTKEELAALAVEMEKRNDEMYWRRREKESGKTRDQIIAGLSPVPINESRWLNQLAAGVPN